MLLLKTTIVVFLIALAFNSTAKALSAVTTEHKLLQYQENGIAKGPSAEIFKLLMAKAGIEYQLDFMPWARAYQIAESTENTIIFSMIRNPEREHKFHWLLPVSQVLQTFVGKSNHTSKEQYSLSHIKKHLTVAIRNTLAHNTLLRNGFIEGENLYVVSKLDTALQLFFDNKVQFIFIEPNVVRKHLPRYQLVNSDIVLGPIFGKAIKKSYIAINKNVSPNILKKLKESAKILTNDAEYLRLFHQI